MVSNYRKPQNRFNQTQFPRNESTVFLLISPENQFYGFRNFLFNTASFYYLNQILCCTLHKKAIFALIAFQTKRKTRNNYRISYLLK